MQWFGGSLDGILCEQYERIVNKDNTVNFKGMVLQIPSDEYRNCYAKIRVWVHCYIDGNLALFHGPGKLADFPLELRNPELTLPGIKAMK